VLERVNRTSDLWQQQSFLGDVMRVRDGAVECREGLPVAYIREKFAEAGEHCFMLTLEFGKLHDANDPFATPRRRADRGEHAEDSLFLHPVVRELRGGAQVSEQSTWRRAGPTTWRTCSRCWGGSATAWGRRACRWPSPSPTTPARSSPRETDGFPRGTGSIRYRVEAFRSPSPRAEARGRRIGLGR
jgi:hypothetical protein